MVEKHPFTFRIEADQTSRYRWMVCEGSQIFLYAPHIHVRPDKRLRNGGTDNDPRPIGSPVESEDAGFRKRHDAFAFYLQAARCQRYTFLFP